MITHYPKDWIKRASAHYCHACEKHPHFADSLLPDIATPPLVKEWLDGCREELANAKSRRRYNALDFLECEVADAAVEILNGNKARAVDEIYDAVAILMRMADMVEGKTRSGKTLSFGGGLGGKTLSFGGGLGGKTLSLGEGGKTLSLGEGGKTLSLGMGGEARRARK